MTRSGVVVVIALGIVGLVLPCRADDTYVTELGRYPLTVTIERLSAHRASVKADMPMPVPPDVLWKVLTNYDRLAEFIPMLRTSHVNRRSDGSVLLTQQGVIHMALYRQVIRVVFHLREEPPHRVAFDAITGDFVLYQGQWRLEPAGEGSRLYYEAAIEPAIRIPDWVIMQLERGLVKATFRAILRRCQS